MHRVRQNLFCQIDGHYQSQIIGVCVNKNCINKRLCCVGCQYEQHSNHKQDFKSFDDLKHLFSSNFQKATANLQFYLIELKQLVKSISSLLETLGNYGQIFQDLSYSDLQSCINEQILLYENSQTMHQNLKEMFSKTDNNKIKNFCSQQQQQRNFSLQTDCITTIQQNPQKMNHPPKIICYEIKQTPKYQAPRQKTPKQKKPKQKKHKEYIPKQQPPNQYTPRQNLTQPHNFCYSPQLDYISSPTVNHTINEKPQKFQNDYPKNSKHNYQTNQSLELFQKNINSSKNTSSRQKSESSFSQNQLQMSNVNQQQKPPIPQTEHKLQKFTKFFCKCFSTMVNYHQMK